MPLTSKETGYTALLKFVVSVAESFLLIQEMLRSSALTKPFQQGESLFRSKALLLML